MKFEPGRSGNPSGRPRGSADRRSELRAMLEPHAPALLEKVIQMALEGDLVAMKLCLERCLPSLRPETAPPESGRVIGFEVVVE